MESKETNVENAIEMLLMLTDEEYRAFLSMCWLDQGTQSLHGVYPFSIASSSNTYLGDFMSLQS